MIVRGPKSGSSGPTMTEPKKTDFRPRWAWNLSAETDDMPDLIASGGIPLEPSLAEQALSLARPS